MNRKMVDYVNKNYYAVKFNAEGDESINFKEKTYTNPGYDPAKANKRNSVHQLARYYSIRSYPSIVFISEDSVFLTSVIGYKKPQQLELYLKLFNDGDYKDFNGQDDFTVYYEAFVPEFTE